MAILNMEHQISNFEILGLFQITSYEFLASTSILIFCLILRILDIRFQYQIYLLNQQNKPFKGRVWELHKLILNDGRWFPETADVIFFSEKFVF